MIRFLFWRLRRSLTQTEAARQLGMSHLTLGYLETGRLRPGPRDRERLQRFFGPPVDRLFEEVHDEIEAAP